MKKKARSLRTILIAYFFSMALTLLAAAVLVVCLFEFGLRSDLFTSANAAELAVQSAKAEIAKAPAFDASLVPDSVTYVFLAKNSALQSNMEPAERARAESFAEGGFRPSGADCYVAIERSDGVCVVHYTIHPRYSVPWMQKYLPNVEALSFLLFFIFCFAGCAAVTWRFAWRMKAQLRPMTEAAEKISEQDLDFTVQLSNVKEFNQVLSALSDMKQALTDSLTQQWQLEQARREQTSALAHDIKTPLTIIHGNAELLQETELTEQQTAYTRYVLKNTGRIEAYLRSLIELTCAGAENAIHLRPVATSDFVQELTVQINGLAAAEKRAVSVCVSELPQMIEIDLELFGRAIMSIVSNAFEYSPADSRVKILIEKHDAALCISVTDAGEGFSPEDLKNATAQFYRGDKSRNAIGHSGIGLYAAERIVCLHHGRLRLANSAETGGGQVTIEIPCSRQD